MEEVPSFQQGDMEEAELSEDELESGHIFTNGYFDVLPLPLLVKIFQGFDCHDLAIISLVSKLFYTMANHLEVWAAVFRRTYPSAFKLMMNLTNKQNGIAGGRDWKVEFAKKWTGKRCDLCGLVFNCFNRSLHVHKIPNAQQQQLQQQQQQQQQLSKRKLDANGRENNSTEQITYPSTGADMVATHVHAGSTQPTAGNQNNNHPKQTNYSDRAAMAGQTLHHGFASHGYNQQQQQNRNIPFDGEDLGSEPAEIEMLLNQSGNAMNSTSPLSLSEDHQQQETKQDDYVIKRKSKYRKRDSINSNSNNDKRKRNLLTTYVS